MGSAQMNSFLRENEIKSVQTTTHAHTVESYTKTFKYKLYRILYSLNAAKSDWVTHIGNIIN